MVATLAKLTVGGNSGDYYLEQVATGRHDYYAGHGEAPGQWTGKGAEQLGLQGEVTGEAFRAVLACRNPVTGERLKRRDNPVVLGFDVTFSAPKSVSALYALGDEHVRKAVLDAHETAVAAGIGYLEDDACVVRLGAQGVDRQPGLGFIVATFRHRTSRAGDPQLHTHAVIPNVVRTADGRAAAFDGGLTYRHCRAAGAVYDGALRTALTERVGIAWEDRAGQWEAAAVDPALCVLWSKRRHEIQDCLDEWEQTSGRAAQYAALHTRAAKQHAADDHSLEQRWASEADGRGLLQQFTRTDLSASVDVPQPSDDAIIEHLVGPAGLTEKTSGFGRRDVLVAAERLLGQGDADRARLNRIADRVLGDDRVLDLLAPAQRNDGEVLTVRDAQGRPVRKVCTETERRYTTVELVNAELDALAIAETGKAAGVAVIPERVVEATIGEHNTANPGRELDVDQAAMVRQLARSGDLVDIVEGRAGSGKTTAVKVYAQAAEKAGIPVIGVAPSATAGHVLGQGADLDDSGTVHGLLARIDHTGYQLPTNAVIVVDEAGMCDTRTFVRLVQAAERAGAKVVALGDDRQVPSVDAGGLFTVFIHRLGAVELTGNHRFADERQRQAAERLRAADPNQVEAAVGEYDELGLLHTFDRVSDAHRAIITDWADLTDIGQTVKMVADSNKVVDDLNVLARKSLVDRGRIGRRGHTYTDRETGRRIVLAQGDRVRLGRNDARLAQPDGDTAIVRNGMEAIVTRTSRRGLEITLDAEHAGKRGPAKLVLPASYVAADVDYGYAVTCDKAQGGTVDHVLYHPTDRSSSERAYVALSRGRHSNRIYAVQGAAWREALSGSRAHTLAADQQPGRSSQSRGLGSTGGRHEESARADRRLLAGRDRDGQQCLEGQERQERGGGQPSSRGQGEARDQPGRSMTM